MATKSVLGTGSRQLHERLADLHATIRSGAEDEAVALYRQLIGNLFIPEAAREDIRREAAFLRGQGREGGVSDDEVGVCLGSSCIWFTDANEECTHGLRYDQRLLDLFVVRREPFAR